MTIDQIISAMQANRAQRLVSVYASDQAYALLDEILRLRGAEVGLPADMRVPFGTWARIDHDGFVGTVQGHYVTREGKPGVVLQQRGTRVVHVYGERWMDTASKNPQTGPDRQVTS